jgi:hypothetical protein
MKQTDGNFSFQIINIKLINGDDCDSGDIQRRHPHSLTRNAESDW